MGPAFLRKSAAEERQPSQSFELIEPEADVQIRPKVWNCATYLGTNVLTFDRFQRFSTFSTLVGNITLLIHIAKSYNHSVQNSKYKRWHICDTQDEHDQAKEVILNASQRSAFAKKCAALQNKKIIPTYTYLKTLNPVLEQDLHVIGGWLKCAKARPHLCTGDETLPQASETPRSALDRG